MAHGRLHQQQPQARCTEQHHPPGLRTEQGAGRSLRQQQHQDCQQDALAHQPQHAPACLREQQPAGTPPFSGLGSRLPGSQRGLRRVGYLPQQEPAPYQHRCNCAPQRQPVDSPFHASPHFNRLLVLGRPSAVQVQPAHQPAHHARQAGIVEPAQQDLDPGHRRAVRSPHGGTGCRRLDAKQHHALARVAVGRR